MRFRMAIGSSTGGLWIGWGRFKLKVALVVWGFGLKVAEGLRGFIWSVFRSGFNFHFHLGTSFVATGFSFRGGKTVCYQKT